MSKTESIYSYCFEGKRYDVGDKLGFLKANIEFALKRDDLRQNLISYLLNLKNENEFNINEEFYTALAKIV